MTEPIDALLTVTIALLVPGMRADDSLMDEVLDVVVAAVMTYMPDERSDAIDRLIKRMADSEPVATSLSTMLSPLR